MNLIQTSLILIAVLLIVSILYCFLPIFKRFRSRYEHLNVLLITLTGSFSGVFLASIITSEYQKRSDKEFTKRLLKSYQIQFLEDIYNPTYYTLQMNDTTIKVGKGYNSALIDSRDLLKEIEFPKILLNNELIMRSVSEEFVAMLVSYSASGDFHRNGYSKHGLTSDNIFLAQLMGIYIHSYYQINRAMDIEIQRLGGKISNKRAKDLYYSHTHKENQKSLEEMCKDLMQKNKMSDIFGINN